MDWWFELNKTKELARTEAATGPAYPKGLVPICKGLWQSCQSLTESFSYTGIGLMQNGSSYLKRLQIYSDGRLPETGEGPPFWARACNPDDLHAQRFVGHTQSNPHL